MSNPIRKAMDILPGNWQQGSYYNEDGTKMCGLGALAQIDDNWHETRDFMEQVAFEQYPDRGYVEDRCTGEKHPSFARFNDHPDTTEDEVLRIMEKAAIRFDEQAGLTGSD